MPTKHLFLIRHGQTEYNRQKIVQGSGVDAPLNDQGHAQARAFYQMYQDRPFELVFTSALRRTHETVTPFVQQGLSWEQCTELNEIGWGCHEGKKSTPEMIAEYHKVLKAWKSGDLRARLGGGESAAEMVARLLRFIERLKARPETHILICSHGRSMRALLCLLLNKSVTQMDVFQHGNTALYHLQHSGYRFKALRMNDRTHLELQAPPSQNPTQRTSTKASKT